MTVRQILRMSATLVSAFTLTACFSTEEEAEEEPQTVSLVTPPSTPPPSMPPPSTPPPPASPPPLGPDAAILASAEESSRFLMQASFGGTMGEIEALVDTNAAEWISAEINKAPTLFLPQMQAIVDSGGDINGRSHSDLVWDTMFLAEDQLRQRMVFALSQILVVSDRGMRNEGFQHAYYLDVLSRNAFGNYRDLLQDVTYSPAMAEYLTYMRNRKSDPASGRLPDENYAREVLQLFTIGLVDLNGDGTPRAGNIETYDNDDIQGLARVFTGLALKGGNFYQADDDARYSPLQMYNDQHSPLEKSFLTVTIPAGISGEDTVAQALDEIFAHPNVGPFVSRQLIQRFTSSDPDPVYVARVANAFDSGSFVSSNGVRFGEGRRGDLAATIAAILLDIDVHSDVSAAAATEGKVREPVLKFVHWARAFELSNVKAANEGRLYDTSDPSDRLAQHPFRSPSVFNFYRPGFVAPGTVSGEAGLNAPELQIVTEGASTGYINFMTEYIMDRTGSRDGEDSFVPDYSDAYALADDAEAMVDFLDILMTAGQMSAAVRSDVVDAVSALEISAEQNEAMSDRYKRIHIAVLMIANSPAYAVLL